MHGRSDRDHQQLRGKMIQKEILIPASILIGAIIIAGAIIFLAFQSPRYFVAGGGGNASPLRIDTKSGEVIKCRGPYLPDNGDHFIFDCDQEKAAQGK